MENVPRTTLLQLLSLAWPVVLGRATQSVIGFTDALLTAPLGEEALAAVTTGALNSFALIILPTGTVFIIQSFAAQLRGKGDLSAVRRYAWYGLWLAIASGVVSLACTPLVGPAFDLFGYAPGVHASMTTYVSIRMLSVAAVVATEALSNWYGGLGNTRLGMMAGIVAMVVNVLGCYALIEPRFGLPGYGVAGAAWSSVFASWLGFAVVLVAFLANAGTSIPKFKQALRFDELLRVLRFGLPNGINWFLEFLAFALFINVVVGHLGTTTLAAFSVVMQLNSVAFMPAFGITSAGAILVGEAIGKQAKGNVWPIVKLTCAVASAWMVFVGLIYFLFPTPLMGLFQSRDIPAENLVAVGATMLSFAVLWQLWDAISMTFSEALRAAGDTTWCMGARIVLAWFLFTPMAWAAVFVFSGGVVTVMLSLVLYLAVLSLVLVWRFASGRWRDIQLVSHEPDLLG